MPFDHTPHPAIFPPASFLERLKALAPAAIKPYAKALKDRFYIPEETPPPSNNSAGSNTSSEDMPSDKNKSEMSIMSVPYTTEEESRAQRERERLRRDKEAAMPVPPPVCTKVDFSPPSAKPQLNRHSSKGDIPSFSTKPLGNVEKTMQKEYSSKFLDMLSKSKDLGASASWDKLSTGSVEDYIPFSMETKSPRRKHKPTDFHKRGEQREGGEAALAGFEEDDKYGRNNNNNNKNSEEASRHGKESGNGKNKQKDKNKPAMQKVRQTTKEDSKRNDSSSGPSSSSSELYYSTVQHQPIENRNQSEKRIQLPLSPPSPQARRFSSSRVSQVTRVDRSSTSEISKTKSMTVAGVNLPDTGTHFHEHDSTPSDPERNDVKTRISPNSSVKVTAGLEEAQKRDTMKVWPMITSNILTPISQKRHSKSRDSKPQNSLGRREDRSAHPRPQRVEESALFQRRLSITDQQSRDKIKRQWQAREERDTSGRRRIEGGYESETAFENLRSGDLFAPSLAGVGFEKGDDGRAYDERLDHKNSDEEREANQRSYREWIEKHSRKPHNGSTEECK